MCSQPDLFMGSQTQSAKLNRAQIQNKGELGLLNSSGFFRILKIKTLVKIDFEVQRQVGAAAEAVVPTLRWRWVTRSGSRPSGTRSRAFSAPLLFLLSSSYLSPSSSSFSSTPLSPTPTFSPRSGGTSQSTSRHLRYGRSLFFSRTLPDGTPWNLATPSIYGLPNTTRNLRIPVPGGELGAWLMEPEEVEEEKDKPMVLYLHGIAQTRGYQHRVGLYLQLLKMGHKVLAVDYRGFADSTELEDITETSVVEDAAAALRYLR